MSVAIPPRVIDDARAGASAAGYPAIWPVLVAVTAAEDPAFDPRAIGDDGSSFGYTQQHVGGISARYPGAGLGDGHPLSELLDGVGNMRVAAAAIGARLAANGGDLADALTPWSTRDRALEIYAELQQQGHGD